VRGPWAGGMTRWRLPRVPRYGKTPGRERSKCALTWGFGGRAPGDRTLKPRIKSPRESALFALVCGASFRPVQAPSCCRRLREATGDYGFPNTGATAELFRPCARCGSGPLAQLPRWCWLVSIGPRACALGAMDAFYTHRHQGPLLPPVPRQPPVAPRSTWQVCD
jgi:hypothetical protein